MQRLLLLVVGLLLVPPALAQVSPGQEAELVVPGFNYPSRIYIPTDYKKGKKLPLIFFCHGSGGKPTSWPWKTATGGKGHIIVGLAYAANPDGGARGISGAPGVVKAMIAYIDKVRAQVDKTYGINQDQVFLTGLSMGGWATNYYGFHPQAKGRYRGYVIMAAGPMARGSVDFKIAKGLPVLVINGANDQNIRAANQGVPILKKAGAIVEFVSIPGEGHVPATDKMAGPLSKWLEQHGPLGPTRKLIAQARKLADAQPGKALALFDRVRTSGVSHPVVTAALAEAKALEDKGRKAIAASRDVKELRALAKAYAGHALGKQAAARAAKVGKESRTAAHAAKGDEALARARKLVKSKSYVKAHAALRGVVRGFKGTDAADDAAKELAALEQDPAAIAALNEAKAASWCKSRLRMAENYARNKMNAKAKKVLDEIIARHPGTKWATKAESLKGDLD